MPKAAKMEEKKSSDKEFSELFIKTGRIQFLIMGLIITGFIIFGKTFIQILFGEEYTNSYYIACILMIPVTIPLIQNVGLNIIQAKNKYRFRTIVFFFIAIGNILLSIPLAKWMGGIGSALATSIFLIIGQGIIMNIYYCKKIHINILEFWKQILKMSIPILVVFLIGIFVYQYVLSKNLIALLFEMVVYAIIYMLIVSKLSMNEYERKLALCPIQKLSNKLKKEEN